MKRTAIAMVFGLALAACGGRNIPPGGDPSGLSGDWFACNDQSCSDIGSEGMRLYGGRWALLQAGGRSLAPGDSYIAHKPWGTYTADGDTITLKVAAGQHEIDGIDRLVITRDSNDADRGIARACVAQQCDKAVGVVRVGPGQAIDPSKLEDLPVDDAPSPSPIPDVPPQP